MSQRKSCLLKLLISIILLTFIVLVYEYLKFGSEKMSSIKVPYLPLPCYSHPYNTSLKGLTFKFDQSTSTMANKLIAELENGHNIPSKLSIDVLLKTVTPVTAISSNHFKELMVNIEGLRKYKLPNMKVIVYDLGLYKYEAKILKEDAFFVYQSFEFAGYPPHVKNLETYAFKPLIIQKVLAERGSVLWMDAAVFFKGNITVHLQHMVEHQTGFLYYFPTTGHSIISATHPTMLAYIPSLNSSKLTQNMPQASGMMILNTKEIRGQIFHWAVLCSLDVNCIAPQGSKLRCGYHFPRNRFGGCHRYDQSMFSILVNNVFNGEESTYLINPKTSRKVVEMQRRGRLLIEKLSTNLYGLFTNLIL